MPHSLKHTSLFLFELVRNRTMKIYQLIDRIFSVELKKNNQGGKIGNNHLLMICSVYSKRYKKKKIKAPSTTNLEENILNFLLVGFIKSIKHFDFLDVPDAKVAVPPQKPAEGRVTNHTCSKSALKQKASGNLREKSYLSDKI